MHTFLRKLNGIFTRNVIPPPNSIPVGEHISDEGFNNYSFVIGSLFTYFNDLPSEQKLKFVKRGYQFKSSKKFHSIGLADNESMAILVSSSAVHVTFGLTTYLLSH